MTATYGLGACARRDDVRSGRSGRDAGHAGLDSPRMHRLPQRIRRRTTPASTAIPSRQHPVPIDTHPIAAAPTPDLAPPADASDCFRGRSRPRRCDRRIVHGQARRQPCPHRPPASHHADRVADGQQPQERPAPHRAGADACRRARRKRRRPTPTRKRWRRRLPPRQRVRPPTPRPRPRRPCTNMRLT